MATNHYGCSLMKKKKKYRTLKISTLVLQGEPGDDGRMGLDGLPGASGTPGRPGEQVCYLILYLKSVFHDESTCKLG